MRDLYAMMVRFATEGFMLDANQMRAFCENQGFTVEVAVDDRGQRYHIGIVSGENYMLRPQEITALYQQGKLTAEGIREYCAQKGEAGEVRG